MTDKAEGKQARKSPEGSIAKVSGGQPDLDVDKLMDVVEKHQKIGDPGETESGGTQQQVQSDAPKRPKPEVAGENK